MGRKKEIDYEAIKKKIKELDKVSFLSHGENDDNGFQIFTPDFIVDGMMKAIGYSKIEDFSKTILEPTSGDGAFTCRILERRLNKAWKDKETFVPQSLRALSTIYSIEMDKSLIEIQRNNIFTIFMSFVKKGHLEDEKYIDLIKEIIARNFIWGMFNSDNEITQLSPDVVYRMPEATKQNLIPLQFPVWTINDDLSHSLRYEDVDV